MRLLTRLYTCLCAKSRRSAPERTLIKTTRERDLLSHSFILASDCYLLSFSFSFRWYRVAGEESLGRMPRAWQRCYIVYATLLSRPLEDHPSCRRFPTKPEFDLNNAGSDSTLQLASYFSSKLYETRKWKRYKRATKKSATPSADRDILSWRV